MHFYKTSKGLAMKLFSSVRFCSTRNIMKLKKRGMIQEVFPNNSEQVISDLCNGSSQCVYAGFDPTARSLHVGHLVILNSLLQWQKAGHNVIILIGGATAQIGDPSGRSKDREELKCDVVTVNSESISSSIKQIFGNAAEHYFPDKELPPIKILDNRVWFEKMSGVEFACEVGRNFRMGTMMSRSSVSSRLSSDVGMSFTEFSYQIFQAYDWLHLFKHYNCRFQLGGKDQMGNIMSGQELISRTCNGKVFGMTVPLVTSETGDKYGKTAGNAVWLDPTLTSPFEFYQFLIRTPDSMVEKLLCLFTLLDSNTITQIQADLKSSPESRRAQKKLAEEATRLVHGPQGLTLAEKATSALYHSDLNSLAELDDVMLCKILVGAEMKKLLLQPGITVKQLGLSACFNNQNDADRIIAAGGFYINNRRVLNPNEVLVRGVHILSNNISLLRVGKKNYWIVKWLT